MKKIRINELARELEVKAHEILEHLPELGVSEKKTHTSSIDEDVALKLRRYYGLEDPSGEGSEDLEPWSGPGKGTHDTDDDSRSATIGPPIAERPVSGPASPERRRESREILAVLPELIYRLVLDRHAPPGLIFNPEPEVLKEALWKAGFPNASVNDLMDICESLRAKHQLTINPSLSIYEAINADRFSALLESPLLRK